MRLGLISKIICGFDNYKTVLRDPIMRRLKRLGTVVHHNHPGIFRGWYQFLMGSLSFAIYRIIFYIPVICYLQLVVMFSQKFSKQTGDI